MTKDEFNNIINFSIIDIMGIMDGGLTILFNFLVNNKDSYEILFWYNKEGNIIIEPEEKLLNRLDITKFEEYDKAEDFAALMYANIPSPDMLLEQYLNQTSE